MLSLRPAALAVAVLSLAPAYSQVFPESAPANRPASGALSLRNLALGELRFTDTSLFNLFDQGGSPMGLLETHPERVNASVGMLRSGRASGGDSLTLGRHEYYLPQLAFFQPGVFGAVLYFQREGEEYRRLGADTMDLGASRFGLDLAAGPASGLFRIGFGMHGRMGNIDYPGADKRVFLEAPSLRLDMGSRVHPRVEIGAFTEFGGRFDSLESPAGRLERVANFALPRYGLLADVGGGEDLPLQGNAVFERGIDRSFGEYRPVGDSGVVLPIFLTRYWTFQTQWQYGIPAGDFDLRPAFRFARRSEEVQGYAGIRSNQNPLKKGASIAALQATRATTSFGLGGSVAFRDLVQVMAEWETSGRTLEADSAVEERYGRISLGLEHRVHGLEMAHIPEGMSLALRLGWTRREDELGRPGYREHEFQPFLPSPLVPTRTSSPALLPLEAAAACQAFSLGFGLGLFEERLGLEGLLSFPSQSERFGAVRTQRAEGKEWGVTLRYRVL